MENALAKDALATITYDTKTSAAIKPTPLGNLGSHHRKPRESEADHHHHLYNISETQEPALNLLTNSAECLQMAGTPKH